MRPKFSNSKLRFAACFYLHEKEILVLIVPVIGHYRLKNKNVFFFMYHMVEGELSVNLQIKKKKPNIMIVI